MKTYSFTLAGVAGTIALLALASPSLAETRPSVSVVLHICDDPGIQPNLVHRAQVEMTRIYRDAGVEIAWTSDAALEDDPGSPPPEPLSTYPLLTLVILCRDLIDEMPVDTTALGGATGSREHRGRIAYVFYDRVERFARSSLNMSREEGPDDMYEVVVLAHAMAHEVGHLLLPYGHSPTGLMRADWDTNDLRLAMDGRLNFNSAQSALMRAQLVARSADTQRPGSN